MPLPDFTVDVHASPCSRLMTSCSPLAILLRTHSLPIL